MQQNMFKGGKRRYRYDTFVKSAGLMKESVWFVKCVYIIHCIIVACIHYTVYNSSLYTLYSV